MPAEKLSPVAQADVAAQPTPAQPMRRAEPKRATAAPSEVKRSSWALPIAALVIAFVIGGVVMSRWGSSGGGKASTEVSSLPPQEEKLSPAETPAAPAPAIENRPSTTKPTVPTKPRSSPAPAAPTSSARPILAVAQLCSALSTANASGDWKCTPPKRPVDTGLLSFYTRLKSSKDTSVKHLWYRDDQLYQSVDLEIGANSNNGYRTYSRYRMSGESSGHWRVEVRAADGSLLHEERFDVR